MVALTCIRSAGSQTIWGCLSHIIREHGFLALWTGILPWTASKIAPLLLSEVVDNIFEKLSERAKSSLVVQTVSLANIIVKCAVCVGAACPFEVITFKRHAHLLASSTIPWRGTGWRSAANLYRGYLVDCVNFFVVHFFTV